MRGGDCSHAMLLDLPLCLHFKITSEEEAALLPSDIKALYQHGLRSFLSRPIATDLEVVGSLMIAKEEADGFEIDWSVQEGRVQGTGRGGIEE
jgi:hypothetical protein